VTTSAKLFLAAGGLAAVALGAITPVGGIAFLAAWTLFVAAVLRA